MCDVSFLNLVVWPYGVWQKRQCLAVEPIRAAGVLKHLYRVASNKKLPKKMNKKISTEWLLSKSFTILLFSCYYSSSYVKDSPQWVWHTLVTPKSVRWVHTVRHPPLTIQCIFHVYCVQCNSLNSATPPLSLTQLYNLHPLETPETTGLIGKSLKKMLLFSYFCTNRLSCQFLMIL